MKKNDKRYLLMIRPLTKEMVKKFLDGLGYDFYSDEKPNKSKKEMLFTFRNPILNTVYKINQYKYKKIYIVFIERVSITSCADDIIVKTTQDWLFQNPYILKKTEDDFLSFLHKEFDCAKNDPDFRYEDIKVLEEWVDSEICDSTKDMKWSFVNKILTEHKKRLKNDESNRISEIGRDLMLENELHYYFEVFRDEVIKLQKLKNKILG